MRINHPFTTLDNQKQKLHNDAMSLKAALFVTALNGRRADNNRQLISKAGRKPFATSPCVTTSTVFTVSHFYLSNSMIYLKICPTERVLDMAESPNPGAVCPDREHSEQHGKAMATASQQMALIYYNTHTHTHTCRVNLRQKSLKIFCSFTIERVYNCKITVTTFLPN